MPVTRPRINFRRRPMPVTRPRINFRRRPMPVTRPRIIKATTHSCRHRVPGVFPRAPFCFATSPTAARRVGSPQSALRSACDVPRTTLPRVSGFHRAHCRVRQLRGSAASGGAPRRPDGSHFECPLGHGDVRHQAERLGPRRASLALANPPGPQGMDEGLAERVDRSARDHRAREPLRLHAGAPEGKLRLRIGIRRGRRLRLQAPVRASLLHSPLRHRHRPLQGPLRGELHVLRRGLHDRVRRVRGRVQRRGMQARVCVDDRGL
jgi:hypothetical protein